MKSQRNRLVLGIVIASVGLVLAWRAMDRGDGPAVNRIPVETPANVEEALSFEGIAFVSPTSENTASLLSDMRSGALAAIDPSVLPAMAQEEGSRVDLADAFRSRLGGFLLHDFDASLEDMISRGWPRYGDEVRARLRERWEGDRDRLAIVQIDPSSVDVRAIDPLHDVLEGFSRSCSHTTPLDVDTKQPMTRLSEPDEGVIELRMRAVMPDVEGIAVGVLLGYRFTWDTELEKWRWIQTCVYRRPDEGSFAAMSPI